MFTAAVLVKRNLSGIQIKARREPSVEEARAKFEGGWTVGRERELDSSRSGIVAAAVGWGLSAPPKHIPFRACPPINRDIQWEAQHLLHVAMLHLIPNRASFVEEF